MCLKSMIGMVLLVAVCLDIPVGQTQEDDTKVLVQFARELLQAGDVVQTFEALLQANSNSDPEPAQVVQALNNLTAIVYKAGEYRMGLELAQHTLAHAESRLAPDHPSILTSVNNLALLYEAQGRYGEAEPLHQRALANRERVLGANHPDTLTSINSLAALYDSQGRYGEAEPLYQRALAGHERVLGADHPSTLSGVNNLAELYRTQGRYGEAEPLYQRALAGHERVLGADHPSTLSSVNNLAALYDSQGRYGEAEPLYQRALASSERVLGADHPDTLTSVNNLGGLYQAQGRYGEAEPLYQRALAGHERVLGADHPSTLTSVNNLAFLYQARGRYGEAEPLYQRALAGRERVLGADHPSTLSSVNNLAGLYEAQGRYGEAEPLYQRALAGRERVLGANHPDTLTSINSLAALYDSQGRYGEAEPLYQRALADRERVLGADHPGTLTSVNNLAFLYQAQGRYGEAEPLYQRALAGRERVLGADHPGTLTSVNNLAFLYQAQGRYGEAEPLYQRALAGRERVLGADHPDTLTSVNNLAFLYQAQGRYGEAELLFQRALASRERVLGADHPATLGSVNNLAVLHDSQGRYGEAEPLYQRALASSERILGLSHPTTLTIQLNTAVALVTLRQPRRALALLKRLEPHLWTFADTQLSTTLQEQVRRQFLVSHSNFQNVVFTLALQPQASLEVMAFAADVLMRWKYVQGEDEAFMARLVRTSGDAAIQTLGKDIMARRSTLSHLANALAADATALRSSHEALEAREVELARLSQRYAQHRQGRSIGIDTIRAHLPRGSALLELRLYRPVDFTTGENGPLHWLALLLPAVATEEQDFSLLDLGPVADSRDLWRTLHSQGDRDTARRLYASLFGRLDDRLQGFEPLYIAPDGFVHVLALPRLVLPDGRYWVERQTLRQLQTGRDMLRLPPVQSPTGLLALGDITYGGLDTPAAGQPGIEPQRQELHRQLAQEIGTMRALAYSRVEVETIAAYYAHPYRGAAQIWRGAEASEARLKALATPPRVLHLATHGFYLSHKNTAVARPMVLSGVALAGANAGMAGHASAEGEDGILYALEAQSLNLEGTELVALSACDTGQGVVDYTEGVYGLVRAFRIAGARRVLMTLWPVNDALAKEFMTRFYWHWLQSDGEPAAALRQTRLEFLRHADPARRDPQVWAPYALVETR